MKDLTLDLLMGKIETVVVDGPPELISVSVETSKLKLEENPHQKIVVEAYKIGERQKNKCEGFVLGELVAGEGYPLLVLCPVQYYLTVSYRKE